MPVQLSARYLASVAPSLCSSCRHELRHTSKARPAEAGRHGGAGLGPGGGGQPCARGLRAAGETGSRPIRNRAADRVPPNSTKAVARSAQGRGRLFRSRVQLRRRRGSRAARAKLAADLSKAARMRPKRASTTAFSSRWVKLAEGRYRTLFLQHPLRHRPGGHARQHRRAEVGVERRRSLVGAIVGRAVAAALVDAGLHEARAEDRDADVDQGQLGRPALAHGHHRELGGAMANSMPGQAEHSDHGGGVFHRNGHPRRG